MGHPYWPLFDLEVRTPRITLRYVNDDLAVALVEVASRGVHDPATMPFEIAWTDAPSPEMERNALRWYWTTRAGVSPDGWRLPLAVEADGKIVGVTDLAAEHFPAMRGVHTGSWLGLAHQGHGIGKEMRLATLALAFDGLGAHHARTAAWHDNAASLGVTRSLGYTQTGRAHGLRRGEPDVQLIFEMDRDHWATIRRDDVEIVGLDPCKEMLGA